MVSKAKMAMWYPASAEYVRRGRAWSCCFCGLLLPAFALASALYALRFDEMIGTYANLRRNVPLGFEEVLRFNTVRGHAGSIAHSASLVLARCAASEAGRHCASLEPWSGQAVGAAFRSSVELTFAGGLDRVLEVCEDPYLGVGAISELGQHIRAIATLLLSIGDTDPCSAAGPRWCDIYAAADEMLILAPEVESQIQLYGDSYFLRLWGLFFSTGASVIVLAGAVLSTSFLFHFWSTNPTIFGRGGTRNNSLLYGCHVITMSLVCATLALPIFVAIDVKLDLGAIQVEGLRREVTLKELGVHIQGSYPDLWAWLFRGEDSGLWTYALAACALFCCGLCLLVFGAAVVVRMPYHGRVPTAADLQREVRRGWPCAPVEELRELERLTPCQRLALAHVRRISEELHRLALPRLQSRVRALGYPPSDLDRALTWIREEAPIIIHLRLEEVAEKLTGDTHYRNQHETNQSGGTLDQKKRMMWEDSLFGGAYGRSSAFERVKYGTINVINDPAGVRACAQYGRSYLLLRRCRLRTTFSAQDSAGLETEDLATVDHYAHVLLRFGDGALRDVLHVATQRVLAVPSGVLDTYREAQVHGEVALAEHVEVVVADPALRLVDRDRLAAEQLARHCSSQVVWIEGDSLPPTPRAAESAGQPLAPAAAAPGPAPSGAAPTSADAPAAALVGAGALGAESGDEGQAPSELLALVLGAAGPSAEANGTYVLRPSAADCERCFAKVGAAPVCLLLETSEGFERWRIGVSDGAGCLLRSAPLPQGHGGDPSEVAVWFSEVPSGGWERQESARVVLRRVPCGTAERMWASGLPAGWDLTQDPGSGRTYYFDWETRRTSWQRPGEQ